MRDTVTGLVLVVVGAGFFAWLALDLADDAVGSPFAGVARAASGAFWWALGAATLAPASQRLGLVVAAGCVTVLLVALGLGLVLTPDGFVTSGVPSTTGQARGLGAVVLAVVVLGGAWWARRSAAGRGEGVEDGPHGR